MNISENAKKAAKEIGSQVKLIILSGGRDVSGPDWSIIIQQAIDAELAKVHKEIGIELMDPNGTIWDECKRLQAEIDALKATHFKCAY